MDSFSSELSLLFLVFFFVVKNLCHRPLFPDNSGLKFVAGDAAELTIGFVNNLERFINFTYVDASLRSVNDDKEVIQNLTRQLYGINTPGKGTSVAIEYQFKPDAMLDATLYVLIVEVNYRDGETNHSEVIFNKTVSVVEPEQKLFNTETAFLVVVLIGIISAVVYFGKNWAQKKLKKSGSSSQSGKGEVKASFLEGTIVGGKSPKKSPKH
jgi:hypothetical protein